jgi:hypothetical protein
MKPQNPLKTTIYQKPNFTVRPRKTSLNKTKPSVLPTRYTNAKTHFVLTSTNTNVFSVYCHFSPEYHHFYFFKAFNCLLRNINQNYSNSPHFLQNSLTRKTENPDLINNVSSTQITKTPTSIYSHHTQTQYDNMYDIRQYIRAL